MRLIGSETETHGTVQFDIEDTGMYFAGRTNRPFSTVYSGRRFDNAQIWRDRPGSRNNDQLQGLWVVVDDNHTNCQILHRQLLSWKMQPDCAARGEQALKIMRDAASEGKPYGLALFGR